MTRLPRWRAGSSTPPSQASRSRDPGRIVGEFSPIPAVKTKASRPPSAAASMPGIEPDAIDEIVERESALRIGARLELAHVVADARKALEAAFAVEQILHRAGAHAFLVDQIEHDAGIDLARPRAHRQAVERGEAHRAFDAAAVRERAHRGAAAEMGDDDPAVRDLAARPAGRRSAIYS